MYNYYLTRKNIISIKISTLTCKFSNPAVINHVKVYIECIEGIDGMYSSYNLVHYYDSSHLSLLTLEVVGAA